MKTGSRRSSYKEPKRRLIEAVVGYAAFSGLSLATRIIPLLFLLVVVSGIAFPLLWAYFTRTWSSMGFTRRNLRQSVLWGLGAGLVCIVYTFLVFREEGSFPPPMLVLQLGLGIPIWFLLLSPFQELFFRGWLQPRFQESMGIWIGLVVTSVCFSLWHFSPPFEGAPGSTLPVTSIAGALTTFVLGMLWGYVFQRTGNIVAPWLAHALAGIAQVLIGTMAFVQYAA